MPMTISNHSDEIKVVSSGIRGISDTLFAMSARMGAQKEARALEKLSATLLYYAANLEGSAGRSDRGDNAWLASGKAKE